MKRAPRGHVKKERHCQPAGAAVVAVPAMRGAVRLGEPPSARAVVRDQGGAGMRVRTGASVRQAGADRHEARRSTRRRRPLPVLTADRTLVYPGPHSWSATTRTAS